LVGYFAAACSRPIIFPCSRGICGLLVDIAILLHINSNFTGANDFTTAA